MPVSNNASPDTISLSADIVAAYVSRNSLTPGGLPALIESIHSTLKGLSGLLLRGSRDCKMNETGA
jgi:predicted transcriptional regulator